VITVLDSTAVISAIERDRDHGRVIAAMEKATELAIGAPTLAQANVLVVHRLGLLGRSLLARFKEESGIVVIPFDERHCRAAARASARYGKERHPAQLSSEDCMTYATAYLAEAPLLSVGSHFPLTDLTIASD
jgi:ribonuclease VapC